MKVLLFALIFAPYFLGCTKPYHPVPLYENFVEYQKAVNTNNIIDVADNFFSSSLLGETYSSNPRARTQLLFKDQMKNIESHHEKIKNGEGCLTINGYDEENLPIVFSLKYIFINDQWLIDGIHIIFIEHKDDFYTNVTCPDEHINN